MTTYQHDRPRAQGGNPETRHNPSHAGETAAASPPWHVAGEIVAAVEAEAGLTEELLTERLGIDGIGPVIGWLYKSGRVDRCGAYVVACEVAEVAQVADAPRGTGQARPGDSAPLRLVQDMLGGEVIDEATS